MMHHKGHQETAVQCTDPETIAWESQWQAGRDFAASFDDPKALFAYYMASPWHRESDHPRARGFREFVIGGARSAAH
ncbi:MAG TPA: hypothetical protein VK059_00515 [Nocardioidaceae bacterium]|nr:hypothetical protein [Nocardioidaceae bacterium]